jgi:hypothetical protein
MVGFGGGVEGVKRDYLFSDVHALSIVVWETLSGEAPFGGESEESIREALRQHQRPLIPSDWPSELREALVRGWSDDVSQRGTAQEMRLALEKCCPRSQWHWHE